MKATKQAEPTLWDNLRSADRYLFGYGSATTLGLVRILIGFLAFANWCMIGLDWDSWFSERGYVPNWLGSLWFGKTTSVGYGTGIEIPRLNLLHGVTDTRITIPFYITVVLAALFTSLGLWTRVSAFLLAVGTVTLHHRNGAILHGGDTVLRLAVIYLAVAPCGRACSVDRLIGLWKGRLAPAPASVSVWSQRLICYNVALIYFTTLWLKWDGDKWHHLIATYYPERLAEFYRFPVPDFLKSVFMARISTAVTMIVEFSMATLVFFKPLRKYVILGGIFLHGYIEYSMNIPLFSFLMMSLYLAFYDGDEVEGWAKRVGGRLSRFQVNVQLPSGMSLQPRAVAFMSAIDPFGLVSYQPGESVDWVATRADGTSISPTLAVASRSIGCWVFAWIPGLMANLMASSLEPAQVVEPEPVDEEPERPRSRKHRKTVAQP